MNKRNYITILLALTASVSVMGQHWKQADTLGLRKCMEYALQHSVDMEIGRADIDDDRIARRDAILQAFTPRISAEIGVYSNFGRSIDPETNTYLSTASFNQSSGISGAITLFNGFEAINNMRISKTAQQMGLDGQRQIVDRICLAVIEAYYNVVYYSQLTGVLEDMVENARQSLLLAQRQQELGQKGYADVVQLEAQVAEREYELINMVNARESAYIDLQDVMFWPTDEKLVIDIAFADEGNGDVLLGYSSADLDELTSSALNTVPRVAIAKGHVRNSEYSLKTARWQLVPSLNLYGGWSTSYYTYPGQTGYVPTPYWDQFRNNGGEYVQLSLSFPIFSSLYKFSNISRRKNDLRRSNAEYDRVVREVQSEVRRAVQDCEGASLAYVQAERQSAAQEAAFELNRRKFEQGLISSIEFQTASGNYLRAKAERLNALLRYSLKSKVVNYYSGIPYLEQEL